MPRARTPDAHGETPGCPLHGLDRVVAIFERLSDRVGVMERRLGALDRIEDVLATLCTAVSRVNTQNRNAAARAREAADAQRALGKHLGDGLHFTGVGLVSLMVMVGVLSIVVTTSKVSGLAGLLGGLRAYVPGCA